jgi:ribosomal peptide maturation radical SAM protein 1
VVAQRKADVCLVLMPYAPLERPSIALGLLKASLGGTGITSRIVHANLGFAEEIGLERYTPIESFEYLSEFLIGEWTFSKAAFPGRSSDEEGYFELLGDLYEEHRPMLLEVRAGAADFVDRVAHDVLASEPRLVGCSSMFHQHCASLALLRRVRELAPDVVTLIGGANCEGSMGTVTKHSFPWIDLVVSGEADELFPTLCRKVLDQGRAALVDRLPYGVIGESRNGDGPRDPPRAVVRDLDRLGVPDYDEYFEALGQTSLAPHITPGLPIETSRGCWWGQKHHCTFCGANGFGMGFRKKSPARVVDEFAELARRYALNNFEAVDNILDMGHLNTALPELSGLDEPYRIFYEVKANLKREHVQRLADAGVCWIQPGIESMHADALRLFDKGNTVMMNLQLLKWSRELGIRVSWNLLCGMPGERDEWNFEMAGWLPQIPHLQPPQGFYRIRFDRFGPYQMRPESFGLVLAPARSYSLIFPVADELMGDLAYFFEDVSDPARAALGFGQSTKPDTPGQKQLRALIKQWKAQFWYGTRPVLGMSDDGGRIRIVDTRPCSRQREHELDGLARLVYLLCDRARSRSEIVRALNDDPGRRVDPRDADAAVEELKEQQLLLELEGKLFALAVQGSLPDLPAHSEFPGGWNAFRNTR